MLYEGSLAPICATVSYMKRDVGRAVIFGALVAVAAVLGYLAYRTDPQFKPTASTQAFWIIISTRNYRAPRSFAQAGRCQSKSTTGCLCLPQFRSPTVRRYSSNGSLSDRRKLSAVP